MSPILSTLIFASAAAAQVTTSIWLPGAPYGEDNIAFQASVVNVDGDAVTMAIGMDSEEYLSASETVTFHGSTAYENVITTSDSYGDYEGDLTVSYGCTKDGNKPVCTYSYNGPVAWSSYCEDYTSYTKVVTSTQTYTYDSPESTVEQIETYDYRDQVPDFCLTGSVLPDKYAINTVEADDTDVQTYAVTITAGENKLSATAGATPTGSAASSTKKTGTASATPTPSGGSGNNSTGPASSGSPSPSSAPVEQSTGAAAPMKTLAPALAGLGALVAALL
jgi:hypothetical protein